MIARHASPSIEPAAIRELLAQLVAIDSVNPRLVPGGAGEAEIARFVAAWLERNGVAADYHDLGDARANVVARVPGTGHGRALLLNAHLDTVGLGGADAGLSPRVEGNRLYGRGSFDMKGSLSAIMLVAATVAERPLAGDVIVTAVADEEAYSIGTEAVAETVTADAAIVAEPTEMRIVVAHKGFAWLEVATDGVAAHGSRYDLGVDAIARMGPVLVGVAELDASLAADPERHPLLGRASLHASLIGGGRELSTYPDRCVVTIERRTLPGETLRDVEDGLARIAGEQARVKTLFAREPLATAPDEPIVTALVEHATAVMERRPEKTGVPFWTDAALLSAAGIPSVVFGPRGEGAHADVEWVDLDDLVRLAQILLATATSFCS
jgi:acetylornithine deacetylase